MTYHNRSVTGGRVGYEPGMPISKIPNPFMQGVLLGLASPLLFFGPIAPIKVEHRDNVARAWRSVGETLRESMKREGARLSDKRR
jgi:hypothetical protein